MYLDIKADLAASLLDNSGNVIHTELLCELIEDAHLSLVGWVVNCQLNAADLQQAGQTAVNVYVA